MVDLKLIPSTKCCNKCKHYLPFSNFSLNNAKADRLSIYCKKCDKEMQEKKRNNSPEKQLEYGRKYQAKRREDFNYRLKMLINASKQRATQKGIEHNLTLDELISIYPKDGKCPVFGTPLEFGTVGFRDNSPSIDKIDPKKGYTLDNVQVLSWRANRLKVDASIEELELLIAYMKQGE
jgi:hypothetical protein